MLQDIMLVVSFLMPGELHATSMDVFIAVAFVGDRGSAEACPPLKPNPPSKLTVKAQFLC